MSDNCPFLEAKGIKHNDNSARGTEICEHCLLEECIYRVKLKGKNKEQYIQGQLRAGVPDARRAHSLIAVMPNKLVVKKRINTEPYAQCLACHYGETLPMEHGKLDTFVGQDGCRYYGKFKQDSRGNVYHNCGQNEWRLCELFTDFRESDG